MRFFLTTLGCKVNQYDGVAVAGLLTRAGCRRVDRAADAELVVVVTCCVTTTAMAKSRQAIRRLVRAAANPAVLVTGCYSDYDADRIAQLLAEMGIPADKMSIIGYHNDLQENISRFIGRLAGSGDQIPADEADTTPRTPATIRQRRLEAVREEINVTDYKINIFDGHQRAFVKVQDGCDAFCTYCIVPFTRPRVRSKPVDQVADECRNLIGAGHKEIVLCGVFLGAYGRGTAVRKRAADQPSALPQLLDAVGKLDGLWRVRLSSLEPADLTDALLAVCCDSPTVAPHFHLPLQSGSDAILERMKRQYASVDFARTTERLRDALDRPAITTDIIVGFPGETDEDFEATLTAARQAGFAKIHAFPFSPIEGTAAFEWRSECPPDAVVKERLARLAELEAEMADDYRRQFVGQTMEGLIESPRDSTPKRQAMTDRYLTVFFDAPERIDSAELAGRVATFTVDGLCADGVTGTFASLA